MTKVRLAVGRGPLLLLFAGIAVEVGALVQLRFFSEASNLNCLGCKAGVLDPVISLSWFAFLSALSLSAAGGAFSRTLAGVGLFSTSSSATALWILVAFYFPASYGDSPWWPILPINWLGAALVLATLTRIVTAPSTARAEVIAPSPQQ